MLTRLRVNNFNLPILMRKTDYHRLAVLLPVDKIDPEIRNKLDTIAATADRARINGINHERKR